jgi:hypothetical protein
MKEKIFINKSKKIIGVKNPRVMGSYLKYGLYKVCDIDMNERVYKNKKIIKNYIKKLLYYHKKNIIKITTFYIYIENKIINDIIKSLGYLTIKIENNEISDRGGMKAIYSEYFNCPCVSSVTFAAASIIAIISSGSIKIK